MTASPLPVKSCLPEPASPPGLKLILSRMAAKHLDEVMRLERESFPQPWPKRVFGALAAHPRSIALVALTLPNQTLAGSLCLMLEPGARGDASRLEVQVQNLAVDPAYRKQGVARYLLFHGLKEARRQGAAGARLEVRPSNAAARALYRSLGFEIIGSKPGYYALPREEALTLSCDLSRLFSPLSDDIPPPN